MKKFCLAFVFLFFLSLPLFCHEGSLAGAGKLRVSQTKYFDIIYSEKNLTTAEILYENADSIFEELAAAYGTLPNFRLPVVITTSVEQFNAYYSDSPYNRIVIYDTAQIEDLGVFSQTLLSVFTHELTHALTYNHKNKLMRTLGKIFGDSFTGAYFTVTSGMAEGATVSYESSKGEGRLNDPYTLQQIRQAKIEGKFPSYSDVKGASDAYPRSSFYYFNGAFAEYLQKEYGMEKYAEFWYRCVNIEHWSDITAGGAFRKTYGLKINEAWKQFEKSVELPRVKAAEPVGAGQAYDFFDSQKGALSIKNRAGSLYTNLSTGGGSFVFVDESCSKVYVFEKGRVKKLFSHSYIDTVKLSHDGRFLALGYYTAASPTIKHCAAIYDMKYKKWISVSGSNYVNPVVVSDGSSYYFLAQNYDPQQYSICVKKLEVKGSRVKAAKENLAQYYFAAEEVPLSFTDLGEGSFAFILKAGLDYSVCVSDIFLTEISRYGAPLEGMKLRDLSASGTRLFFSWAQKESLPRLGYLDLQSGTFGLAEENISGGVYSPVDFQGHLYYSAHFFRETRLLELADPYACKEYPAEEDYLLKSDRSRASGDAIPYKSFNAWDYAFEGLFLPLGGINSNTPLLGFTYINSLPWYSSIVLLSGGYETSSKTGVFDISYQSGTDTGLFTYLIDSSFAFDDKGFKTLAGDLSLGSAFDFGKTSQVAVNIQTDARYGRLFKDSESIHFSSIFFSSLAYSNMIQSGPGTHEKAGITFATGVLHTYLNQFEPVSEEHQDNFDLEFDFIFYIPKLLPLICLDNFTYNLPLTVKTSFFSLSTSDMPLAKANAETILFAYDIQKAIPGFSALFANDIMLTFAYTGGFAYQSVSELNKDWHFLYTKKYLDLIKNHSIDYKDYYTLKLQLDFTPNIGYFANPQMKTSLYAAFNFGKKENLPDPVFSFGLQANFL